MDSLEIFKPSIFRKGKTRFYRNIQWNFELEYPENWEIKFENTAQSQQEWTTAVGIAGFPKEAGVVGLLVNATYEPPHSISKIESKKLELIYLDPMKNHSVPLNVEKFIRNSKLILSQLFDDINFEQDQIRLIGDKPAIKLAYTHKRGNERFKEWSITSMDENITFQFICEAPEKIFDRNITNFEKILNSFKYNIKNKNKKNTWDKGDVLLDEYSVEEVIGQGGMGNVYLVTRKVAEDQKFAVKVMRDSLKKNKDLISELSIWLNLPEHPNINTCRFFKTIENQLVIFSDFADDGTLKEWIANKKALELPTIIDICIQSAHGLQVAHEHGVIHQDVKPTNILMAKGGTVKITDFGIAGISQSNEKTSEPDHKRNITAHAFTQYYCSPEQFKGEKLTKKTDMWSWGLTVLEMFTGEVVWVHGTLASEVLQSVIENGPFMPYPPIPHNLSLLLQRCFARDPEDRWENMQQIIDSLKKFYLIEIGLPYNKAGQQKSNVTIKTTLEKDIKIEESLKDDPHKWLRKAFGYLGKNLNHLQIDNAESTLSEKSKILLKIKIYSKALSVYQRLVKVDRPDLKIELAEVLDLKAQHHLMVEDTSGAIELYDLLIRIREKIADEIKSMSDEKLSTTSLDTLATAYFNKGLIHRSIGELRTAFELNQKSISIWNTLSNGRSDSEFKNKLANSYSINAVIACEEGEHFIADEFHMKAIDILSPLVKTSTGDVKYLYANCCMNRAVSLNELKQFESSIASSNQAIGIWDELILETPSSDQINILIAKSFVNQAIAKDGLGDHQAALSFNQKAIDIFKTVLKKVDDIETENALAAVSMNCGGVYLSLRDLKNSVTCFEQSIQIREKLVYQMGRTEFENLLALSYYSLARLAILVDHPISREMYGVHVKNIWNFYDKAIKIWENSLFENKNLRFVNELTSAYIEKANSLPDDKNNEQKSLMLYDKAIFVIEKFVKEDNRIEGLNRLASLYLNKAYILKANNEFQEALLLVEKAIECRKDLINNEGIDEVEIDLGWGIAQKAHILHGLGEIKAARIHAKEANTIFKKILPERNDSKKQNIEKWIEDNLSILLK